MHPILPHNCPTKQAECCVQAPPLALRSVLEGEIRAFASQQGVDGHRQCMRKFLELLLARGGAHL